MASRTVAAMLVAVSALFFSFPAVAKDHPKLDWTGFYVGLHLGAGWSRIQESAQNGALSANQSGSGVFGGGHAGYDWEWGRFVLGLEGDFSGTSISGQTVCPQPTLTCQHEINWVATLRPRAGVLVFGNRMLLYATGGVAFADIDYKETNTTAGQLYGTGYSKTHTGWTCGAGVEYLVVPHISVRVQFLHDEFGDVTTAANTLSANAVHISPSLNEVDAGFSYRF
jgi:outer membrane immunogenic protein